MSDLVPCPAHKCGMNFHNSKPYKAKRQLPRFVCSDCGFAFHASENTTPVKVWFDPSEPQIERFQRFAGQL